MRVVIGYDGSDSARSAIRALQRAGIPQNADVRVVSVADVSPERPPSPQDSVVATSRWRKSPIAKRAEALAAEARAEAQALAAEGAALVRSQFPSWTVTDAAYAGSPYQALIELPDGAADLVVLGSQGKSAIGRLLLGSVSQTVLTHAARSVRISRHIERPDAGTESAIRIVLGVEGSVPSATAVSAVAARAWPEGTEVKVVAVLDRKFWTMLTNPTSSVWAAPWAQVDQEAEDSRPWAYRAVESVAEELHSVGLHAIPVVEEGDPKKVLVEIAERWSADCIFLGAKGHSGLERFLFGSVSAAVAARAPCSVEVVRMG